MSITNNSKRKSRIPNNNANNNRPNKPTRVRPKSLTERSNVAMEGVYSNARFMHAAACSVGCVLHVQVGNGNIYEGVFSTFSQDLDLVLEMVNLVDRDMSKVAEYGPGTNSILHSFNVDDLVAEKMVFKLSDIVSTCAAGVDLDFATKDGFTDTAISMKYAGGNMPERELEPWDAPPVEELVLHSNNLDVGVGIAAGAGEEETKGWDANEMFRTNAEKYNVKSTYDSSLQGYTIPLEPKNTDEYKKQEAKAAKLAQEIENNPSYKQRIGVENGDEEERFSAVVRPDNMTSSGRYPPKKSLQPSPGSGNKVLGRSPMPPYAHPNKTQDLNSVTPTHSYKNNVTPPSSLPLLPINMNAGSVAKQIPNVPLQQQHYMAPPSRAPIPVQVIEAAAAVEDKEIATDENQVPLAGDMSSNKKLQQQRDDKKGVGRDEQIAEFKKFSSDFKLSEDHRPGNETEDSATTPSKEKDAEDQQDEMTTPDNSKNQDQSDSVKKHILNPNAKTFTPRMPPQSSATPPITHPPRLHTQSPVVAVPQHQLVQGLGQPIFTAMAPQYVMPPNPTMSLTPPFAPGNINQAPRFRKQVPMNQQDFSPSVHVAAATGPPILTPGITTQQLAVQYNAAPGMMAVPSPHQAAMATNYFYRYPTMVGPRVVSPQGSYGEVFMSPHPGTGALQVSAVQTMVPQQQQNQHSNQQQQQNQGQCTPMHTAPSPVHQQQQGGPPTPHGTPSQTPTPTGHQVTVSTPQQSVVYHSQMGPATMQGGGLHNQAGVPTSQAMQLHASHLSQGHPHHSHHPNFATTHQVVLMHQQAIPTHGPHPASLTSSGPHSLQGHGIHGQAGNHLGNPQHVLSHAPMTVIPTSAAMVHSMGGNPFAQHHQQQQHVRERGRQHTGNR